MVNAGTRRNVRRLWGGGGGRTVGRGAHRERDGGTDEGARGITAGRRGASVDGGCAHGNANAGDRDIDAGAGDVDAGRRGRRRSGEGRGCRRSGGKGGSADAAPSLRPR